MMNGAIETCCNALRATLRRGGNMPLHIFDLLSSMTHDKENGKTAAVRMLANPDGNIITYGGGILDIINQVLTYHVVQRMFQHSDPNIPWNTLAHKLQFNNINTNNNNVYIDPRNGRHFAS
jgi:hypothetical protein